MNLNVGVYQFEIQNMVASANVGHGINLKKMQKVYPTKASYEPELFPGLVYRDDTFPAVLLIFDSGRMVLTGCKTKEDIYITYDKITPIIAQFIAKTHKRKRLQISDEAINEKINEEFSLKDFPLLDNALLL